MAFTSFELTNEGINLLASVNANLGSLKFTRFKIGNGTFSGDIKDLTDVINEIKELNVTTVQKQPDKSVKVQGTFDNSGFLIGYQWREIGLYAQLGDTGTEILYSYSYNSTPDTIPAYDPNAVYRRTLDVRTYVGDTSDITFEIIELVNKYDFNTVAEMQAAPYLTEGDRVKLWGYYSLGDGGGHERIFSLTDDGSGIAFNGGYAVIIDSGTEVNPLWYGVIEGEGVSEAIKIQNTTNMEKCMSHACQVGAMVRVPIGFFYFKELVIDLDIYFYDGKNIAGRPQSINIVGSGKAATRIYVDNTENFIQYNVRRPTSFRLENMYVISETDKTVDFVYVVGMDFAYSMIKDVFIDNFRVGFGLQIWQSELRNIRTNNCDIGFMFHSECTSTTGDVLYAGGCRIGFIFGADYDFDNMKIKSTSNGMGYSFLSNIACDGALEMPYVLGNNRSLNITGLGAETGTFESLFTIYPYGVGSINTMEIDSIFFFAGTTQTPNFKNYIEIIYDANETQLTKEYNFRNHTLSSELVYELIKGRELNDRVSLSFEKMKVTATGASDHITARKGASALIEAPIRLGENRTVSTQTSTKPILNLGLSKRTSVNEMIVELKEGERLVIPVMVAPTQATNCIGNLTAVIYSNSTALSNADAIIGISKEDIFFRAVGGNKQTAERSFLSEVTTTNTTQQTSIELVDTNRDGRDYQEIHIYFPNLPSVSGELFVMLKGWLTDSFDPNPIYEKEVWFIEDNI